MFKKIGFLLLSVFAVHHAMAQQAPVVDSTSHLRISLLTCGVGSEIWETFGHTAVRVVDSQRRTDLVYNYGTFDGYDKDFEIKFMRGKLPYYVSIERFDIFMQEYTDADRIVQEQVLDISGRQKEQIDSFLEWNAQPDNRYYKYDFYFDNCATRIRDIFPKVLGPNFHFGQTLPQGARISYRNITDQYLYQKHWERFGIDLLLGKKVDKPMTNEDAMFLPDFLRDGIAGATLNGRKVAKPAVVILPGKSYRMPAGIDEPLIMNLILAILIISGLLFSGLTMLGRIMSNVLLLCTGLLGCLMLFMWFGTDHQACQDNFNILWALPTNLIFAFVNKRKKSRYALVGIVLILVSLVLHVLKIQELPLFELWPILLSLLFIYGMVYRRDRLNAS